MTITSLKLLIGNPSYTINADGKYEATYEISNVVGSGDTDLSVKIIDGDTFITIIERKTVLPISGSNTFQFISKFTTSKFPSKIIVNTIIRNQGESSTLVNQSGTIVLTGQEPPPPPPPTGEITQSISNGKISGNIFSATINLTNIALHPTGTKLFFRVVQNDFAIEDDINNMNQKSFTPNEGINEVSLDITKTNNGGNLRTINFPDFIFVSILAAPNQRFVIPDESIKVLVDQEPPPPTELKSESFTVQFANGSTSRNYVLSDIEFNNLVALNLADITIINQVDSDLPTQGLNFVVNDILSVTTPPPPTTNVFTFDIIVTLPDGTTQTIFNNALSEADLNFLKNEPLPIQIINEQISTLTTGQNLQTVIDEIENLLKVISVIPFGAFDISISFHIKDNRLLGTANFIANNNYPNINSELKAVMSYSKNNIDLGLKEDVLFFTPTERDETIQYNEDAFNNTELIVKVGIFNQENVELTTFRVMTAKQSDQPPPPTTGDGSDILTKLTVGAIITAIAGSMFFGGNK